MASLYPVPVMGYTHRSHPLTHRCSSTPPHTHPCSSSPSTHSPELPESHPREIHTSSINPLPPTLPDPLTPDHLRCLPCLKKLQCTVHSPAALTECAPASAASVHPPLKRPVSLHPSAPHP